MMPDNDNHRTYTVREKREFLNWLNCWQYMVIDHFGPPPENKNKKPLHVRVIETKINCALVGVWYPACTYVSPIEIK
jgi:hypothetical protein